MFPLILTVLERDYTRAGYYNPDYGLLVQGGTSQPEADILGGGGGGGSEKKGSLLGVPS